MDFLNRKERRAFDLFCVKKYIKQNWLLRKAQVSYCQKGSLKINSPAFDETSSTGTHHTCDDENIQLFSSSLLPQTHKKMQLHITESYSFTVRSLGGLSVSWPPSSLCHARWAASPSCACFLTRLKGCFWHPAVLPATPPAALMPGRRKKLVTWPSPPCPRPLPPCREQKVCWSEAMPGTLPAAACDVTTDTHGDKTSDWLWGVFFLTSRERPL